MTEIQEKGQVLCEIIAETYHFLEAESLVIDDSSCIVRVLDSRYKTLGYKERFAVVMILDNDMSMVKAISRLIKSVNRYLLNMDRDYIE